MYYVMMQLSWLLLLLFPYRIYSYSLPENATEELHWGTYRPGLYFGVRPRLPQSLMTGLIWFGTQDYQSFGSAPYLVIYLACYV